MRQRARSVGERVLAFALLLAACGNDPGAGTDGGGNDGDGMLGDGMEGDGPVISTCPARTWCVETPPATVTGLIHSIDAADANDVFAVGDGGTIIRRQNGAWTTMTSNTTLNLRGLWVLSGTDAWAAGQDGTVLHWDGSDWSAITGGPADVDYAAAWGSAADNVWFVGTGSAVRWNGTALSNPGSVITGTPVSISGSADDNVWIAAETGRLSRYTTSWMLQTPMVNGSSPGNSYFAVAARANDDVWASLPGTGTIRWNGSSWAAHSTEQTLFASIHAPAADHAWGVGGTKVGHWNGTSWTISSPVAGWTNSLYGVTGAGPHTWAVGQNGGILYHRD